MSNDNRDDLLLCLLDCGSLDLSVLDDIEQDLCEIVEELQSEGVPVSLNAITGEVFQRGQRELEDAVNDAIEEREQEQLDTDSEAEYDRLQEEIDELKSLDPDEDMKWHSNCLDTSCWFSSNEEIYRKYLSHAIEQIEDNMGFEF